jgi:uncharacterized paraquat-inducible protein A
VGIDSEDYLKGMPSEIREAHKRCSHHRDEMMASTKAGCFYCLEVFSPTEIDTWIDHNQTAMCPRCGIDSTLPGVDDEVFLRDMHKYWFENSTELK